MCFLPIPLFYTGEITMTVGRCTELEELFASLNKHLINKAVGRTQKTSFPLSSNSKASLCSDFKTNPNSCEQIQAINICHFTAKALAIHHGMEQRE